MKPSVSIVVPTRNEAENIDLLLTRIFAVDALREYTLEVVFSDGASEDATCKNIRLWQHDHPVQLLTSNVNRGLSAAVMAGAREATGEYVVVMDADLSHPPEKIPELLDKLRKEDCDMVIGSRYVEGGSTPDWPASRRLCSLLATLPARFFTDVKDPLAGFFCLKRTHLATLTRNVCGFKIGLELLSTIEQPFIAREVPITFHDRCHGDSKMGLVVIRDYFHQLLQLVGISFRHTFTLPFVFAICLLAGIGDYTLLQILIDRGMAVESAHCFSFAAGSLLAGGVIFIVARSRHLLEQCRSLWQRVAAYLYGMVLLLLLRAPLVQLLAGAGLNWVELLFLAALSTAIAYLAQICFVFSIGRKRINGELVLRFYGLGFITYLLVLRLVSIPGAELLPEERFILSQLGVPRLVSLGCWLIGAASLFGFTRELYDRATAFKAVLLFSLLPLFFSVGLYVSSDSLLFLLWVTTLFFFFRYLSTGEQNSWVAAAITAGILCSYDLFGVVLVVGAAGSLLLHGNDGEWLKQRKPLASSLLFLGTAVLFMLLEKLLVLPVPFNGRPWLDSLTSVAFTETIWAPLLLLGPVPLLAIGLGCCHMSRSSEKQLFMQLFFVFPFSIAIVLAIASGDYRYCNTVVWLALLPCLGATVTKPLATSGKRATLIYRLWWLTMLVTPVLFALMLLRTMG